MKLNKTARAQYIRRIDSAAKQIGSLRTPPEGWLVTIRKAFSMSGTVLGKRMGIGRASISRAEKAELKGGVTLKFMERAAKAMGCRFIYAIVPDGTMHDLIEAQAVKKAKVLMKQAGTHMALEQQSLSHHELNETFRTLVDEMMRNPPRDFWVDE